MKQLIFNHLKNIYGWKTQRKIVVFSVDDYGNVRVDSKKARLNMDNAGLKILCRFDAYDTLETREDLEMLFEVLSSFKDKYGRNVVFTPFAVPCNINYEQMEVEGFQQYHFELLPDTYKKLEAKDPDSYTGAWQLWKEGIEKGLMTPQFHGREHLNLKVLYEKLSNHDHEVLTALRNRSYTSISSTGYSSISYTAAFDFWEFKENELFSEVIKTGLDAFEQVFGYRAVHFNPPGSEEHPVIHQALSKYGISYIDTPLIKHEHQGFGKYKTTINYTRKKNALGQTYIVRNVVFEPNDDRGIDWVSYTLKQIEAAFLLKRPAIVSSHRVNFCGHIDPENRKIGIKALRELLKKIVQKWPDVEFISADELGDLIVNSN